MYAKLVKAPKRQGRRRHGDEFKHQVIAACQQPGISIAAVALANGLNANLLRRWVKEHREAPEGEKGVEIAHPGEEPRRPTLVPITVSATEIEPAGEIKIAIHRDQTLIEVAWPVSQAAICAQWLREILR